MGPAPGTSQWGFSIWWARDPAPPPGSGRLSKSCPTGRPPHGRCATLLGSASGSSQPCPFRHRERGGRRKSANPAAKEVPRSCKARSFRGRRARRWRQGGGLRPPRVETGRRGGLCGPTPEHHCVQQGGLSDPLTARVVSSQPGDRAARAAGGTPDPFLGCAPRAWSVEQEGLVAGAPRIGSRPASVVRPLRQPAQ